MLLLPYKNCCLYHPEINKKPGNANFYRIKEAWFKIQKIRLNNFFQMHIGDQKKF